MSVRVVERRQVRLVQREVDVVEAEALGGRARELLWAERAGGEQHLLGRPPGGLGLLDGRLHALLGREAELDDHIGDEATAATSLAGWRESGPRINLGVYGRRCGRGLAALNRLKVWSV